MCNVIRVLSVSAAHLYFKIVLYISVCTHVIVHALCVYRSFCRSEEGSGSLVLTLQMVVHS